MLSEDGDTFVVQAGPEFKILGKNSLNEMTHGVAGHRARQPDHPHAGQAVSHRAEAIMKSLVLASIVLVAAAANASAQVSFATVGSIPVQAESVELQDGIGVRRRRYERFPSST